MSAYTMPADTACALLTTLETHGVSACVGGGWAVDALVRRQTREHSDLDLWVVATDLEGLFVACAEHEVDRIHPWPGDRPWNFVLHDGRGTRVDLHLFEPLGSGRLHYGSVTTPFLLDVEDLSGHGEITGMPVRCERPEFALSNHTGYAVRAVDRHDVAVLSEHFALRPPDGYG